VTDQQGEHRTEQIDTGGGAYVKETVNTTGGDFVGRDKIIHIHNYPPIRHAPLGRCLTRSLLENRTALFGACEDNLS
jgi:hypothetical protein